MGGIRSMTGHGVGEATLGDGRVAIEVRAVNHRYLDVRVRLPPELAEHTARVEDTIRRSLKRGRVEVQCRLEGNVAAEAPLHMARARAAYAQLDALRSELGLTDPVPLSALLAVPNLFCTERLPDVEGTERAIQDAATAACEAAWEMRRVEGEALASDLSEQLTRLETHLSEVEARCPEIAETYRDKLVQRIEHLLADSEASIDQGRIEHEVAMIADRADVAEEITRLKSHCSQMRGLLNGDGPTSGKRLDFLLQEMNRETNTIGSKCSDAELAQTVVEMKVATSRMREQVQNVL